MAPPAILCPIRGYRREIPAWERQDMTVCIAAVCKNTTDAEASIAARNTFTATFPNSISANSNRVRLGVDDVQRTERAIKGIVGKRLMYR